MKQSLLLVCLLSLAACGYPVDSPTACAFSLESTLPLTFIGGVPLVEVKVNGTPLHLVLDTGASYTVITEEAGRRASVARDSTTRVFATGVGGQAPVQAGLVGRLELATARQTDMMVFILLETRFGKDIDGLLGEDVLSDYDLDLDTGHNTARLYRKRNCPSGRPNWSEQATLLPRAPGGQAQKAVFFEALLDGVPLNAVIDSGAGSTTVLRSRALSMGITDENLSSDPTARTQGVAPGVQVVPIHAFKTLQIGAEVARDPKLRVAPIGSIGNVRQDLLLGEDYLRKHRVWISYGSYTAFTAATVP